MRPSIGLFLALLSFSGTTALSQTFEECRYVSPGADKRAYLRSEVFMEAPFEIQESIVIGFFDGLLIARQFGMSEKCIDEIWECLHGTSPKEITQMVSQHLHNNPQIAHWPFGEAALDGFSSYCHP